MSLCEKRSVLSIRKLTLDFINHPQAARGYGDRQLAVGWRIHAESASQLT